MDDGDDDDVVVMMLVTMLVTTQTSAVTIPIPMLPPGPSSPGAPAVFLCCPGEVR
jgi:hypothetical protein